MPDSLKQFSFETIILTILAIVVLVVCVGCIYAFVRAIYMFIFSHGDWEKIKQAYSSIRFMILWILLTVMLLFIFPLILKWMKVPDSDTYNAKNIFNRAWEVIKWLTDMGNRLKNHQDDIKNNNYEVEDATKDYSL